MAQYNNSTALEAAVKNQAADLSLIEDKMKALLAEAQSLAQMAIAWLLKDERVTSVLIGASSVGQLKNNLEALQNLHFTQEELDAIEAILK